MENSNYCNRVSSQKQFIETSHNPSIQQTCQEYHLENWIRKIAEDRCLLLHIPMIPIPILEYEIPIFPPSLLWDTLGKEEFLVKKNLQIESTPPNNQNALDETISKINDTEKKSQKSEINFVCGLPNSKILVVGSCKGDEAKFSHTNLLDQFYRIKENTSLFVNLLKHLGINDQFETELKIVFVHFAPEVSKETKDHLTSVGVYALSLVDMLEPFNARNRTYCDEVISSNAEFVQPRSISSSIIITAQIDEHSQQPASSGGRGILVGILSIIGGVLYSVFKFDVK